jgi:4-hydroxy-3-polyprenylbenzoate decarboxylase
VRIVPPMPAFYNHPASVDDVIDHITTRVLDQLGLPAQKARRWSGLKDARDAASARLGAAPPSVPQQ